MENMEFKKARVAHTPKFAAKAGESTKKVKNVAKVRKNENPGYFHEQNVGWYGNLMINYVFRLVLAKGSENLGLRSGHP